MPINAQAVHIPAIESDPNLKISLVHAEKIEKSRIVFLAGVHCKDKFSDSRLYQIQSVFNQAVIESHYTPQDLILVEDSWKKRKEELASNQVKSLCFENYKVEGWDDPGICEQALVYKKEWEVVESAILTIKLNRPLSLASLYEKYEILVGFAKQQSEIEPTVVLDLAATRSQIYSAMGPNKNFLMQKRLFLDKCETALQQRKKDFVLSTFDSRQQSLFNRVNLCLERTLGKVFVLLGPNHIEDQLVNKFKHIPYIVLDAEQLIKN